MVCDLKIPLGTYRWPCLIRLTYKTTPCKRENLGQGWRWETLDTKIIHRINLLYKLNNQYKLKNKNEVNVDANELPQRLLHGKGTTNSEG